jgi:hypothetical protein
MNPVATSDAAFRGGACPTPEYTIAYTGNYTTSADANCAHNWVQQRAITRQNRRLHARVPVIVDVLGGGSYGCYISLRREIAGDLVGHVGKVGNVHALLLRRGSCDSAAFFRP